MMVCPEPDKTLLTEEVRIGCMQGMLQCLEKKERIAFILGEILEITDSEASEILSISRETFRKRLSRGRARPHRIHAQKLRSGQPG